MKKIVFISRGRPGLGHVVPCVALENSLKKIMSNVDIYHISYGLGLNYLSLKNKKIVDLDFTPQNQGYPGLPLFRGLYPNLKNCIKKIKPDLIIGSGDYHIPLLAHIEKMNCCMLLNSTYLTMDSGYFSEIKSLLLWLYKHSDLNIEYNLFQNDIDTDLRKKTFHSGPILRNANFLKTKEAKAKLGLPKNKKIIVVTKGGGDQSSNDSIKGKPSNSIMKTTSLKILYDSILAFNDIQAKYDAELFLFGGFGLPQEVKGAFESKSNQNVHFQEFTDDILYWLQAADVVIGRAGLNFISEAIAYSPQKTILIPMSSDNEQINNVNKLNKLNLCYKILSDDLNASSIKDYMVKIFNTPIESEKVNIIGNIRDGANKAAHRIKRVFFT